VVNASLQLLVEYLLTVDARHIVPSVTHDGVDYGLIHVGRGRYRLECPA
jgi:hypothetical protein